MTALCFWHSQINRNKLHSSTPPLVIITYSIKTKRHSKPFLFIYLENLLQKKSLWLNVFLFLSAYEVKKNKKKNKRIVWAGKILLNQLSINGWPHCELLAQQSRQVVSNATRPKQRMSKECWICTILSVGLKENHSQEETELHGV